ncbi:DEK C terminal domain [Popillia japonica]|uniref:protein-serine/threonine phosphatase n=1 Tax=Popillia japonica TaxID=7064 RepID=A0AAW1L6U8_POPJA
MMVVHRRNSVTIPSMLETDRSALQTLHKVSSKAREENYYQGGLSHTWVNYYENRIESERSCLNEWHAMDNLESRRPPSPDSVRTKPTKREETERVIRSTLKEIMMSVDLDEVTSKYIRSRLEEDLDMDLGEYKSFIDQEMLTILGQMDSPTEIFDHVYLGSEWNASNYEELQRNGVGHILNVTREIDNFFPGNFDYLNVRVYDDEKTDLLKHWDDTFKYISKARQQGSKVLVHCKMGISRSASVVIAYAMKAYNWEFKRALQHVKEKRSCIKPNTSFLAQLETYQGMLVAMKNKEKLQRSKSETNLKSPGSGKEEKVLAGSKPTPLIQSIAYIDRSGHDLRQLRSCSRPKSWSPDLAIASKLLPKLKHPQVSRSMECLHQKSSPTKEKLKPLKIDLRKTLAKDILARNVLLPCDNGESYSVSPNQIMHLPGNHRDSAEPVPPASVKDIVNELELQNEKKGEKKKLVLNLLPQFNGSAVEETDTEIISEEIVVEVQTKSSPPMLRAVVIKKEIWDPGEIKDKPQEQEQPNHISIASSISSKSVNIINNACDVQLDSVSDGQTVWTSSAVLKTESSYLPSEQINKELKNDDKDTVPDVNLRSKSAPKKEDDPFSNQLDRVFDREERRHHRVSAAPAIPAYIDSEEIARESPSRQNSWSSYDSAVGLGYQGERRDTPSRHSSWGSGDTRTLPSRNSSWGSYDMRPGTSVYYVNEKGEKTLHPSCNDLLDSSMSGIFQYDKDDIPWYPGTVKRTKQKLEDNASKKIADSDAISDSDKVTDSDDGNLNLTVEACNVVLINKHALAAQIELSAVANTTTNSSAISAEIDIVKHKTPLANTSRLSVSAPETSSMELVTQECSLSRSASNVSNIGRISGDDSNSNIIDTVQCSSVKQHKNFLENLHRKSFLPDEPVREDQNTTNTSGIVRYLKEEFEAKTNLSGAESEEIKQHKINRSAFLNLDRDAKTNDISSSISDPGEDLNLKKLIGKFEVRDQSQVVMRPKQNNAAKTFPKSTRHSCFEVSMEKNHQAPVISTFNKNGGPILERAAIDNEYKRPPISPTSGVVVATVIATAAVKKQQQFGKSHPLARLKIRPRHNSPVFNTM